MDPHSTLVGPKPITRTELDDFHGYQDQVPTSQPQKYWHSLAFEVLTDTSPQVSLFLPLVN